MILNELYELYGRLMAEGAQLPSRGRSLLPVSFRIVLDDKGELLRIEDARSVEVVLRKIRKGERRTEKIVPTPCLLLGAAKPSGSRLNPCFLWDNAAYLLGYVGEKQQDKAARIRDSFECLRRKHLEQEAAINSPVYSAVCRFLENWKPEELSAWVSDVSILSHNGVFRIQPPGELITQDVHEQPCLCRWWDEGGSRVWWGAEADALMGRCLVTNAELPIARLHEPAIKGVLGAQSSGAKLVSFNCKSFESYGFEQSVNAPVSEAASFAYCNALNYLLSSRENRVRIGESTVVFWTDAPPQEAREMETLARCSFDFQDISEDETPTMDAETLQADVRLSLQQFAKGQLMSKTLMNLCGYRFFILGLSPNAARLSVRFYHESTFGEFLQHLRKHYEGLSLAKRGEAFKDPDVISPFMILRESVRDVSKELPPASIGHLMNAILGGSPYPNMLAMSILRRFKADGNINYIRCAFLKAWLNRNHHLNITTMLDSHNTHPGYLLGRLFALLVKTQEDALGKNLNRTLRDSYYSSASVTPLVVFPRLIRLFQYHLSKLDGPLRTIRDKQVQEIMWLLGTEYPSHLTLAAQGCFALGYYHQTQDLYTKKTKEETSETTQLP